MLPGTLADDELRARLARADAVAVLKLGRTFDRVRAALADTGLLHRARYVERAGTSAQRVEALADVDPASVPYMSLALVPGRGQRSGQAASRVADGPAVAVRAAGTTHEAGAAVVPAAGLTQDAGLADSGGRVAASAGRVIVVGLGPGDPRWLTPEAEAAVAGATDLVGYRPYLARLPERAGPAPARLRQHRRGPAGRPRPGPGCRWRAGRGHLLRRSRRVRHGLGRHRAGGCRAGPLARRPGRCAARRDRRPGRGRPGRRAARPRLLRDQPVGPAQAMGDHHRPD